MAVYRYLVTVETIADSQLTADDIANEIDSNLEYDMLHGELEDFTIKPAGYYPGQGFAHASDYWQDANRPAPLSPDGRYND